MKSKINTIITNPYFKIFGIILFFTIFSFLFEFQKNITNRITNRESNKPVNHYKTNTNYIGIFVFRFIHYLMLFYFAVFLLFFKEKGQNAYIYILSALILCFSWFFFDCCIVSYHELLFYGVDHNDYITSFHPCLYVVFDTYQWIPLTISGVIMFFTVFYLLWKNTAVSLILRIFIGVVFLFLFVYNLITTRYYDSKLKYPLDSEHILYKYFTLPRSLL